VKKESLVLICRVFFFLAFLSLALLIFGPWEGTEGSLWMDKALAPFKYVASCFFGGGEQIIPQSELDPSLSLLTIDVLEDKLEEAKTQAIADPSEQNMTRLKGIEQVLRAKVLERDAKINKKIFSAFLFCTFFGLLVAVAIAMERVGEVSANILKKASFWQAVLSVVVGAGLAKLVFPRSSTSR
jgi:hypothetical protein